MRGASRLQGRGQWFEANASPVFSQNRDIQVGQGLSARARSIEVNRRDGRVGCEHTLGGDTQTLKRVGVERWAE